MSSNKELYSGGYTFQPIPNKFPFLLVSDYNTYLVKSRENNSDFGPNTALVVGRDSWYVIDKTKPEVRYYELDDLGTLYYPENNETFIAVLNQALSRGNMAFVSNCDPREIGILIELMDKWINKEAEGVLDSAFFKQLLLEGN